MQSAPTTPKPSILQTPMRSRPPTQPTSSDIKDVQSLKHFMSAEKNRLALERARTPVSGTPLLATTAERAQPQWQAPSPINIRPFLPASR